MKSIILIDADKHPLKFKDELCLVKYGMYDEVNWRFADNISDGWLWYGFEIVCPIEQVKEYAFLNIKGERK